MRGLALLGILMMNMPLFANPPHMYVNLSVYGETGLNYWAWWVVNVLLEGSMRGLFSLLFGAGSLLLLERLEARGMGVRIADIFYRRMIVLILFGLFNAFVLLWPGDILFHYGVCGLFLFPFRKLSPRWLTALGVGCLLIAMAFAASRGYGLLEKKKAGESAIALAGKGQKLTEKQEAARKLWQGYLDKHTPEKQRESAEEYNAEMRGGYVQIAKELNGWSIAMETIKLYNDLFWDALGMFFLGMALFKWRVLTGEKSLGFYLGMTVLGLGIGLPISIYFHNVMIRMGYDSRLVLSESIIPLYQVRRIFLTAGYLGLFLTVYKMGGLGILWRWLGRVGQMAFTNYLMQTVFCTLLFYGYGLGYFGRLQRYETYYVVAAIWVIQMIYSNIWLRYFRFGPFEWVWRSLTYWERVPIRKSED